MQINIRFAGPCGDTWRDAGAVERARLESVCT